MKILWFTTSPSLGAQYLNHTEVGCSWIESLEIAFQRSNEIELGIAFLWNETEVAPFENKGTRYYPVRKAKSSKNRIKKIYSRWSHRVTLQENVPKYLKVIEEFKPDLIHIFGTENDYGEIVSHTHIPCVIHIQGNLVVYGHKWFSGIDFMGVIKYSEKIQLLRGFGLLHDYYVNQKSASREKDIFMKAKYFMGRTDWDRRLTAVLSPDARYFHCDEIMKPEFYERVWKSKIASNEITIISVIRANIYKGLETILESMRILKESDRNHSFTWKVAGTSREDDVPYLVHRKFGVRCESVGIQLLGALGEIELADTMQEADLFVHPSHIDNSPNSICEAMLLGMPIIATYAGGIPSLITDKKEGILVQDGDPYALAGAILEQVNQSDQAMAMARQARQRAITRNDPDKIKGDLMDIYTSILKEGMPAVKYIGRKSPSQKVEINS